MRRSAPRGRRQSGNGSGASGSCCGVKDLGDRAECRSTERQSHDRTRWIGSEGAGQATAAGFSELRRYYEVNHFTIRSLPIEQWGRDPAA